MVPAYSMLCVKLCLSFCTAWVAQALLQHIQDKEQNVFHGAGILEFGTCFQTWHICWLVLLAKLTSSGNESPAM